MYLFYCWWTVWAIMNTLVHVLYMYPHIHMHIPRSRITGSLGLCLTFLAVFQNACTNLHSYQQSVSVSIVPHSHQHLTVFLNFSHSGGCVEESRCGLICLSLRTNEVRQLSDIYCTTDSYEVSVEVFCPLFLLSWQSFLYWFDQILYIFWIQVLRQKLFIDFVKTWYTHDRMV